MDVLIIMGAFEEQNDGIIIKAICVLPLEGLTERNSGTWTNQHGDSMLFLKEGTMSTPD